MIVGFILATNSVSRLQNYLQEIPLNCNFSCSSYFASFIFLEETINCIDYGHGLGCRMTTWINVVLLIQVFILCLIVHKKKMTDIKRPLLTWYAVNQVLK